MTPILRKVTIVAASLSLIVSIALLATVATNHSEAVAKQTLTAQAQENVFMVTDGTTRSGGTGFVLNTEEYGKLVVTNRHVCAVADEQGYLMLIQNKKQYWSKIIARSNRTDLCLIYAPSEVKRSADGYRLSKLPLYINQEIVVFGHPWLSPLKRSGGNYTNTIIGYFNPDDPYDTASGVLFYMQRLTVHISPGNSGSPLLNTQGEVVGVIFAFETRTGQGLAVPAQALREFINEVVY